jgi:thiamine-phosphate pyrophosphorylase
VAAGADGVHLGQDDLPVESARRVVGGLALIGGSAHDLDEAARNQAAGCDYCGVGRFAASGTKPEASEGGPGLVRAMATAFPQWPQLVIGGVDLQNIDQVIAAGGCGVAMSAAICGADDPAGVVADVRNRLQQAVESFASTASGSVR